SATWATPPTPPTRRATWSGCGSRPAPVSRGWADGGPTAGRALGPVHTDTYTLSVKLCRWAVTERHVMLADGYAGCVLDRCGRLSEYGSHWHRGAPGLDGPAAAGLRRGRGGGDGRV